MEIRKYIIEKEVELEEAVVSDKELKALAREGDKYLSRLPKRDIGKEAKNLSAEERQKIASFVADYRQNVERFKSLKPKITPLRDDDISGRKSLKIAFKTVNAKLKKNYEGLPGIEAKLVSGQKKIESKERSETEKKYASKTRKATMASMEKQDKVVKAEKKEAKTKAEEEKARREKAEAKKKEEKEQKRQKWVAQVKARVKRGK